MYPRPHEGHLLPVTSEDSKAMTDPEVSTPALQQNKQNLRGNPYSWARTGNVLPKPFRLPVPPGSPPV